MSGRFGVIHDDGRIHIYDRFDSKSIWFHSVLPSESADLARQLVPAPAAVGREDGEAELQSWLAAYRDAWQATVQEKLPSAGAHDLAHCAGIRAVAAAVRAPGTVCVARDVAEIAATLLNNYATDLMLSNATPDELPAERLARDTARDLDAALASEDGR